MLRHKDVLRHKEVYVIGNADRMVLGNAEEKKRLLLLRKSYWHFERDFLSGSVLRLERASSFITESLRHSDIYVSERRWLVLRTEVSEKHMSRSYTTSRFARCSRFAASPRA